MKSNIANQARNHLLAFLRKVEDESYTRNEYENFALMSYQTPELEQIRVEVCAMIAKRNKDRGNQAIGDQPAENLAELIALLEHGKYQEPLE